jgi:hypothetical protein
LRRTIDWFRSQSLVLEPMAVPVPGQPALLAEPAVREAG